MRVIGTAGHVDHGKSTLVLALTGIDPDRLKEEKSRGMTIDLGFAWFDLPIPPNEDPEPIGIVDVPGHIDFIKNMLAGVGGIDAALLVIAADEGVMPQTQEHLDILTLLAVPSVIVALTKIDAVDDAEWLDLVELDIAELLQRTPFAEAPIVRVSPMTGEGMGDLEHAIARALSELPERRNRERPRLPIDRAFSISGFGTIVTGTLSDGRFAVGDAVSILPEGAEARIRGLQTHQQQLSVGEPGSRLAINLSGVSTDEIARGSVVVHPGTLEPTTMVDVSFEMLASASKPILHNKIVSFFTGATETTARVRLLGADALEPGDSGWLQLRLEQPIVTAPGDRYILRQPSPSMTLGGGVIVDAHPRRRWRRFDDRTLERLKTMAAGAPDEILLGTLADGRLVNEKDLVDKSGLDVEIAKRTLEELISAGAVTRLGTGALSVLLTIPQRDRYLQALLDVVGAYHNEFPLRTGMPRGELHSRLKTLISADLDGRAFSSLLDLAERQGMLTTGDNAVWQREFVVELTETQQERVDNLMVSLERAGASPPNQNEHLAMLNQDVALFEMLVESGKLVRIRDGVVYRTAEFELLTSKILEYIEEHGSITLAEARDLLGTSRKYAQAILEELDDRRVTRREGDVRVLRS